MMRMKRGRKVKEKYADWNNWFVIENSKLKVEKQTEDKWWHPLTSSTRSILLHSSSSSFAYFSANSDLLLCPRFFFLFSLHLLLLSSHGSIPLTLQRQKKYIHFCKTLFYWRQSEIEIKSIRIRRWRRIRSVSIIMPFSANINLFKIEKCLQMDNHDDSWTASFFHIILFCTFIHLHHPLLLHLLFGKHTKKYNLPTNVDNFYLK